MAELINSFQTFVQNVRIVDFFDVAIISLCLYLLINWFRESASRRTIISLLVLILVYILARLTEMYLTEIFIEGLFIFIIIGLVVVFQSDIRRLIDQIGSWHFRKGGKPVSESQNLLSDTITEAAGQMAKSKTGALIALRGVEEWDRHINGGIKLNADLSIPLLRSIFNPTAPGHDGAVLIEGTKISKFSVHLPLSTHLHKISQGGTRHAAALGLSEVCDAMVVVVSEERGIISVAQSGQLRELESASKLKEYLLAFEKKHHQEEMFGWSYRFKRINPRTATAAVAFSILLWFTFAYDADTIYRSYDVPIEYRNLNTSNIVLQDSVPTEARVTLSGAEQAFQLFDPAELAISFNLDSSNFTSDSLVITEQNINLPSDLDLYNVSPHVLRIRQPAYTKIDLPVRVPTTGVLPSNLTLQSISTDPSSVALLATQEIAVDSISTTEIDLSSVTRSDTITGELVLPPNTNIPQDANRQVSIRIVVEGGPD